MKARRAPVSIRLSKAEHLRLKHDADAYDLTLSAYIRERLFDDSGNYDLLPNETRQKLLAQILAELGSGRVSNSLTEIAEAANVGLLVLTPEIKQKIHTACGHVQDIHSSLLRALGLRPKDSP